MSNILKLDAKILATEHLLTTISEIRHTNSDTKIAFTNGCFDILHRGHVSYLDESSSLANILIVALNTDLSVTRQNKTHNHLRPINSLEDRMAVVAALASVSYVTFFDSDTPLDLIKLIKPDVLIKGGDWQIDTIVGATEVLANGAKVYSIPFRFNRSTSKLLDLLSQQ